MRLRTSSLLLAGALIASGGALAVADTATPDTGAPTTEVTAPTGVATATPDRPRTPPGQARTPPGQPTTPPGQAKTPPGQAKKAERSGEPGARRGRGPDATGPAAYGLCRAWAEQADPASKAERGVPPFRNLAAAAGGAEGVADYCAALPERPAEDD